MSFPYSENPGDWQKAYTRDQAHRDSGKYALGCLLPVLLGGFFSITYALFWTARFPWPIASNVLRLAISLLIIVAALVIFLVMLLAAFGSAVSFLNEFYSPAEGINPGQIIRYRLFGKIKLPPPLNMLAQFRYILIKDGEIAKAEQWPAWAARHMGGPLVLIVFDGFALYLERGNRFSRVVGPGSPFLEWFETIKYVVDLRPKVKTDKFDVWTKDGIKIKLTAQIECRIGDPANKPPAADLLYPFDPVAVKKAVERTSLRWPNRVDGEPSEFTWIDAAWGQVTGIVPGYIGSRMLDDLFMADRENGQILSPEALKELFDKLNGATKVFGVFVTDFQIMKVDFPEEVYMHQKEQWKAERQSIATIRNGETKAYNIRIREKERADALRNLILTIATGLDKNKDDQFNEALLLSLSGFLDESLSDPLMRAYLAREKLESLEELQKILNQPSSSTAAHLLGNEDGTK